MAITNDYGVHIPKPSSLLRLSTLLTTWLHFSSTVIVLGISAYFINTYTDNTHLVFWLTIACIDTAATLPYLGHPFFSFSPLLARCLLSIQWLFSYLWLTAFIFAAQDYNFNGTCALSPAGVGKCGIKRTLEAFAFLAFFTGVLGQLLESRLFGLLSARKENVAPVVEKPVEPTTAADAV
jgi:hypothetical protein